ncbi:hypothetical protein [Sphingobacterium tabacisoli]|uniref:PBCV-specific basic adaptor domain-containing protein n=1 Tax=Sphingobacterium tabacisoli TaxID=2044855 RepID=A0ABW5L1H9_9SPHI|nr:hypothetical protein [Sphingobacterium tabacisoli]
MKTLNSIQKLAALAAVVATLGLGSAQAQTAKTVEKPARKTEVKAPGEQQTKKTENKAKEANASVTKKESQPKETAKSTGTKAVKDVKKEEAVKADQKTKTEKKVNKTTNPSVKATGQDKLTGEKHNGHPVYEGPKGGKYYINENGNKTYIK